MRNAIYLTFADLKINETFVYLSHGYIKKNETIAYNRDTQTFVTINANATVMTVR